MSRNNVPMRPHEALESCQKQVTQDFLESRSRLKAHESAVVETIVESFNGRPDSRLDIQFNDTPIGTCHTRARGGVYVFYQKFNGSGRHKYRILFWHCGTYLIKDSQCIYDFDDVDGIVP